MCLHMCASVFAVQVNQCCPIVVPIPPLTTTHHLAWAEVWSRARDSPWIPSLGGYQCQIRGMFFPSHQGRSKFIFLDGWQEAAVAHGSQFWDTLKKIQSLILMLRSVHIGCPTTAVLWGLADQSWLGLYMMLQGELESWGINWTSFF